MRAMHAGGAEQQLRQGQVEQRLQFIVLPVVADGRSHGGTLGSWSEGGSVGGLAMTVNFQLLSLVYRIPASACR